MLGRRVENGEVIETIVYCNLDSLERASLSFATSGNAAYVSLQENGQAPALSKILELLRKGVEVDGRYLGAAVESARNGMHGGAIVGVALINATGVVRVNRALKFTVCSESLGESFSVEGLRDALHSPHAVVHCGAFTARPVGTGGVSIHKASACENQVEAGAVCQDWSGDLSGAMFSPAPPRPLYPSAIHHQPVSIVLRLLIDIGSVIQFLNQTALAGQTLPSIPVGGPRRVPSRCGAGGVGSSKHSR